MQPSQNGVPLDSAQKVDELCDRFESQWLDGKRPRIEDFLSATPANLRTALFKGILPVELELHAKAGKTLIEADYLKRFPAQAKLIAALFKERTERTTKKPEASETSVSRSAGQTASFHSPGVAHSNPLEVASQTHIGRFKILAVLGQGAFGRVYKAHDPKLDRHVAIKVPLQSALDSPDEIDRFLHEARAAATLHHPNLCPVHEVGQDKNGAYYIVMAFVEGTTLSAFLRERKEPVAAKQAALIVRKLALALGAAHAKGIVHRDLKPANIMVGRERKDVIIMDFGLARHRKNGDAQETREGVVMGTPAYMSPEQARGDVKAIGPASDIYGLGVILYEMLAGKVPFSGSVTEVLGKVLHVEPEPPSTHRAGVDPQLEAICMKAIAKAPAERFASMKALAEALESYLKGVPSESITTRPKAKTIESAGLSQVFEALSAERKVERAALEKTVGKQSRFILTIVLAAFGLLACLMVGGIIVFFFRTPNTLVQITLITKIDQRLLDDKTISYYFDDKLLSKEDLERPINLTPGRHILQAKRGDDIVHEVILVAGGEGNNAKIDVTITKEYEPSPKKIDTPKKEPPSEWVSLFNGKDLTGWEGLPGAWKLDGGALVGVLPPEQDKNTFLCSKAIYRDFELKFQVKLKNGKGNSGVQVRSNLLNRDEFRVAGPQVDIDSDKNFGGLYGELSGKGWMRQAPVEVVRRLFKPAEFNDYFVRVLGKRVKIVLNSETIVDDDFPEMADEGIIAFQLHGSLKVDEVTFQNVLIRDLSPKGGGFVPLFNGKDLSGWKTFDPKQLDMAWHVKDGILYSKGKDASHLFSPRDDYENFHFLIEAKISDKGNSGQYFRTQFGPGYPKGYEAQINSNFPDPQKTGSLYTFARITDMLVPPETWFTQEVIANGNHIQILVDGKKVVDFKDEKNTYTRGHFAIQQHGPAKGGSDVVVAIKRMEVKELPRGAAGSIPLAEPADPDRAAAELVQSLGGQLVVRVGNNPNVGVNKSNKLPTSPFRIRVVNLDSRKGVTNNTLVQLRLASLSELTEINLTATAITDAGLLNLRDARSLQRILLCRVPIRGPGLAHLAELPQLRSLELDGYPQFTNAGMPHLRQLTNLNHLSLCLNFDEINDTGLAHLEALTNLERLELMQTNVSGTGFTRLKGLTKLKSLDLRYVPITNQGLAAIAALPSLENLNLEGGNEGGKKFTNAGLAAFRGNTTLRSLSLVGTEITDAAVPDLATLTGLKTLHLRKSKVTAAGTEALEQALPNCVIDGERRKKLVSKPVGDDGFVSLFNGKDLTGWQGLVPINARKKMTAEQYAAAVKKANKEMQGHWTVKDGVLHYDGKNGSLQTVKDYGNFELFVDWKIGPNGDSGIYLRGYPQVQIWDINGKNNPKKIGSGGLYNNLKNPSNPLMVADNPIGEWNNFHIVMKGDKVTVKLNGKLVVDNTPLENHWERGQPLSVRGPIELQHHGDQLWFKYIYLKELPD